MKFRYNHLSQSLVTIANVALHNSGLHLHCMRCGRVCAFSPAALADAELPRGLVWDFKRKRRCSRCGARGSTDDVELRVFVVNAGVIGHHRSLSPSAPQLWPGWSRFEATPPQLFAGMKRYPALRAAAAPTA